MGESRERGAAKGRRAAAKGEGQGGEGGRGGKGAPEGRGRGGGRRERSGKEGEEGKERQGGRERGGRKGRGGEEGGGEGARFSGLPPLDRHAPPCYHGGRQRGESGRSKPTGAARREPGQSRFCSPTPLGGSMRPRSGVTSAPPAGAGGDARRGGAHPSRRSGPGDTVFLCISLPPLFCRAGPKPCPASFFAGIPLWGDPPRRGRRVCRARRLAGSLLPAGVGPPRRAARGAEADGPSGRSSAPGAGEEPPRPRPGLPGQAAAGMTPNILIFWR